MDAQHPQRPHPQPSRGRVGGGGGRGWILPLSLLVLTIIFLLGGALLGFSLNEYQATGSHRDVTQALYVAETGIERSLSQLAQNLQATPGKADFDTELGTNGGWLFGGPSTFESFTVNGQPIGTYRVQLSDNADGGSPAATDDRDAAVWATSEGIVTVNGHRRTKRVKVLLGPSTAFPAFLIGCESGLTLANMSGNPVISGSRGSIHSNCDIMNSGRFTVSQDMTASGTITNSGTLDVSGETTSNADPIPVPVINPADFKPQADYIFKESAGRAWIVRASDNATVYDSAADGFVKWPLGSASGWKYSGTPGSNGKWDYNGTAVPAALAGTTLYFEKKAGTFTGNVVLGTKVGPWQVTILAEGYIEVPGDPSLSPDTQGLVLVAGTDLKINGNCTITNGILAAHEQIDISGNKNITGAIIVENAVNADIFLTTNNISGNPHLTYDGVPPLPVQWNPLRVLAWLELN